MSRSETGHIPMRMCIICRQSLPKSELTRLNEGGKGKYVCSNEACITKAEKRFAIKHE